MSNKQNGNRFEQELARMLSDAGFWVHVLQQNKAGQPADLILAGKNYTTLIDCKLVSKRGFGMSRIEENQWHAMLRFERRTGNQCWFAMKLDDGSIWFVPMHEMEWLKAEGKTNIPIVTTFDGKIDSPNCCCDDLYSFIQIAKNGGVPI